MKKLLLASILITASAVAARTVAPAAQAPSTAFVGVHVIPMDRETVLRDHVVVVRDGRIVEVGPAGKVRVPDGATRVDGAGKYLMPAIAEMHAHIPGSKSPDALVERVLFLYAANGVGTIRGMLGDPRHLEYRQRAAKGELISPRIYTSGPTLNGKTVPTKEIAIQEVTAQRAAGYDLLKIHPGIQRDVFEVLAAKAHEVGIDFAGHVPLDVGLRRALELKYRSIDHLDGYVEALSKNPMKSQFFGLNLIGEVDESQIPALVAATKEAGTWMVPTQVLFDNLLSEEDATTMSRRPEMKYALSQDEVKSWIEMKESYRAKIPAADRQKFLALRQRLIKALYEGGVPFALGSDAPQWWNVPGFSAHRELQSMVAAGLTPYQALHTGTVKVGEYFGTPDTGTIAAGKRADLVLVDANPLEDIANSARIAGVVLNGRWLPKSEIDKRLQTGT